MVEGKLFHVRVVREKDDLKAIQFLDRRGHAGPFSQAIVGHQGAPPFPTFDLIAENRLLSFLLERMEDRSELYALADYSDAVAKLRPDADGNPKVWSVIVRCPDCEEQWYRNLSNTEGCSIMCPVCGADGIVDEETLKWIGPKDQLLRDLWEQLPAATFVAATSCEMGAEATIEVAGGKYRITISKPDEDSRAWGG